MINKEFNLKCSQVEMHISKGDRLLNKTDVLRVEVNLDPNLGVVFYLSKTEIVEFLLCVKELFPVAVSEACGPKQ